MGCNAHVMQYYLNFDAVHFLMNGVFLDQSHRIVGIGFVFQKSALPFGEVFLTHG